jgi:hypothetical protein
VDPVDLIKRDLGADGRQRAILVLDEELSVFSSHKIYRVTGNDRQFDFQMLPHGSCGYYAANGWEAVRLTRAGKEIQRILAKEWPSLVHANPVRLASLILRFFDGGIKASHRVLAGADDLRSMCRPPRHYDLNEKALAGALPELGVTSCSRDGEVVVLRAITLLGWMHEKRNLGVEMLTIHENGTVTLDERRVLAEKVFDSVPAIRY